MKKILPIVYAIVVAILFFFCLRLFFINPLGAKGKFRSCQKVEAKEIPIATLETKETKTLPADTVVIKKGGSLCRDLQMTTDEAYAFAERYGLKHYYSQDFFIVIVHRRRYFRSGLEAN
jgi:hypothetical protein